MQTIDRPAPVRAAALLTWVLWCAVFIGGCGIAWLIPPFQSPDENAHLGRAYLISHGQWLLEREAGSDSGGRFDRGMAEFLSAHVPLVQQPLARLSPKTQQDIEVIRFRHKQELFSPIAGTGYYLPVVYAAPALAFVIGERLDMTVANTYRLSRMLTLATVLALLAASIRILRPNVLVVALLLLPMTVFQIVSPTLDGMTSAIALLAVALFLRAVELTASQRARPAWGLAICLLLLGTSRTHLLPMLLLPFYLAWRRRSIQELLLAALVVTVSVAWVLFSMRVTVDTRVVRAHGTAELLFYYALRPWEFFGVVWATVSDPGLWDFYLKSFIGNLGWLDTALPLDAYPVLWAGLGLCGLASVSVSTLRQDAAARAVLVLAGLGSIGMVFLAMLVTWTAHPADKVLGVQGRYFLVPIVVIATALSGTASARTWSPWWRSLPLASTFAAGSLGVLITTLFARYH